ncbi:MAG TPA: hypothetical protein VFJ13_05515, partial [Paracoccaceae bacterium]|nr:hypothetical protein [Paracoccaceae bacterium]
VPSDVKEVTSEGQIKRNIQTLAGYIGNSVELHEYNEIKSGGVTDVLISRLLRHDRENDEKLEAAYRAFCQLVDVDPVRMERKYWPTIL